MPRMLLVAALLLAGCAAPSPAGPDDAEAPDPASDPAEAPARAAPGPGEPAAEGPQGSSSLKLRATDVCTGAAPFYCLGYSPRWGELQADGEGSLEVAWNASVEGFETIVVFLVVPGGGPGTRQPDGSGASPITIDLGQVAEGSYHVRFWPAGEVRGPAEQAVDWRVLAPTDPAP